jgi:hypothetical protein
MSMACRRGPRRQPRRVTYRKAARGGVPVRPRAGRTGPSPQWLAPGGRVEDMVVIELDVPRAWLRRNRRQLGYSVRDVPPGRFTRVIDFAEVAGGSTDLVA